MVCLGFVAVDPNLVDGVAGFLGVGVDVEVVGVEGVVCRSIVSLA